MKGMCFDVKCSNHRPFYFPSALQCPVDHTAFAKKHVSNSDMTSVRAVQHIVLLFLFDSRHLIHVGSKGQRVCKRNQSSASGLSSEVWLEGSVSGGRGMLLTPILAVVLTCSSAFL